MPSFVITCFQFLLICCFFIGLSSSEVILKSEWRENRGWDISCSWQTWLNDTLQSVRMFRNENQFFVYRPEIHGHAFSETIEGPDFKMSIVCKMADPQGQRGKCGVLIDLYRTSQEDTYRCEMSGEKPTFRFEAKEITVYVPPSEAVLQPIEVLGSEFRWPAVNCTSQGLPAPKLVFSVDTQKIPEDFTHTRWNSTTKLWHSWASYNPQKDLVVVTCTPEATRKTGAVERGMAALWTVVTTSGCGCCLGVIKVIVLGLFLLPLLR